MSADERLERLERRVAVLEGLVRASLQRTEEMEIPAGPPPPPLEPARPPAPPPRPPRATPTITAGIDEQWIGQRGLLAVGVVALLMATGYLLKLSFERGWVSPLMRCVGGALLGAVVGAIGWRLHERYRTYGAALVGSGAGIIYLSVWAACRLYGVIPTTTGIVGLALVSVALAVIAYAINVQALGITAALGAFMAPVLLGRDDTNANLLLLYLACMAAGLGLVSARRHWRLAMLVVAASYFGVGLAGAREAAEPWGLLLYGLVGGAAGLYVGLSEQWGETRFLAFSGGWALLGAAGARMGPQWPVFAAGIGLSAPVWWQALRRPRVLPLRVGAGTEGWSLGEVIYFFTTPVLLSWAAYGLAPDRFDQSPGLLPLLVAVPYLLVGYLRPRAAFALVGIVAAAVAAQSQWSGVTEVWALLALALLWAGLDHPLGRTDGRWYGMLTWVVAVNQLAGDAASAREASDAAFTGPWALALWGTTLVTATLAAGLLKAGPEEGEPRLARSALWLVAGFLILFGVTAEIRRYFDLESLSRVRAELASGLSVSAWWLVFAAVLVIVGFRRALKPVRVAGLAVAGLAVGKVVAYDLSSLDSLYRVGLMFLLALVALSLAYLYYRNGRVERAP